MKYFVILYILFISYISKSEINSNSFVRLNVDLNGVVKAENKIIIYGSGGCLMFSDDNANTWSQESISDSLYIVNLKYNQGKLLGIVLSLNSLVNYEIIYDLTSKKYFLTEIKIPYKGYLKWKEYNNNQYFASNFEVYSFNNITKEVNKVYSDSTLNFNYFTLIDNYIFMNSVKDTVIKFNLLTKQIEHIQIKGYSLFTSDIFNFKNTLFTTQNNKMFKSNNYGVTWDSIFNILNPTFFITNNDVLYTRSVNKSNKFEITELSDDGKNFKFNKNYPLEFKSYIEKFQISNIFEIDSNIMIAVGIDKLILKMNKKTNECELVSSLNRKQYAINVNFFDKSYGIAFTDYNQFYKTFDSGATWMPINQNQSIPFGSGTVYMGSNFVERDGRFMYINPFTSSLDPNLIVYSTDTCKTFNTNSIDLKDFPLITNIIRNGDSIYFALLKNYFNNKYSLLYTLDRNFNIKNIQRFDSLGIFRIYINSNSKIELICNEYRYHNDNYIGNLTNYYDSVKVIIKEMNESSNSWDDKLVISKLNKHYLRDYLKLENKLLILSVKQNYDPAKSDTVSTLFEIENGIAKLLYTFNDRNVNSIVNFNGTLFYMSVNKYYYQDSKLKWISKPISTLFGGLRNPYFAYGNTMFFASKSTQLYDKDYTNIYRYTDESPTSDVEAQIEDMTDLVTLNPSPLPANTFTKIGVIWSPIYKFDLSNIEVYDIYGVKVKSNLKTSLREFDTFRGELTLQTEDLPNGVFFIRISHGITTKYVKILVSH
ncbi:MAG: hypothetical protein NTW25_15840 [Candidatus Kapabacteria bacterium]|nr:hypothetical protein [Candidatus Kapabacteria bacterium]